MGKGWQRFVVSHTATSGNACYKLCRAEGWQRFVILHTATHGVIETPWG